MFRFGARFTPSAHTCFRAGASSVNYFGKDVTRRSFNRQRTSIVSGFIDTSKLISVIPTSAFASIWCKEQADAGGIIQLGSEDALNGVLGSTIAAQTNTGCIGGGSLSNCATIMSRTMMSNAMSMQWSLCCCKTLAMVRTPPVVSL